MSVPPSALIALEAALASSPTDLELRVHLAGLYCDAEQAVAALTHATTALEAQPDHVGALRVAARAAAASGDMERAKSFARLADALGGSLRRGGSAPEEPTPVPLAQPIGAALPDTADDLLDLWSGSAAAAEPELGQLMEPGVRLADVGGLNDVKTQLDRSFLGPLRNPELRAAFGKSLRGGLLLWGPPGCGKTFLARAVAGELGARFYSVGLADVLDMWIGSSERNLRSVFEVARRNRPCVLFFDELDALGHKRANLRGGAGMRGVVNQLLSELDGIGADNDGVFVLGASNHPWDIDEALLRPGRFDRKLLVLPPDEAARAAILGYHLRNRPVGTIDLAKLAARTERFSGADLALVAESATETALAESTNAGRVIPITQASLEHSAAATRPSVLPWFETAKNYAVYANNTGEFDGLLAYIKRQRL